MDVECDRSRELCRNVPLIWTIREGWDTDPVNPDTNRRRTAVSTTAQTVATEPQTTPQLAPNGLPVELQALIDRVKHELATDVRRTKARRQTRDYIFGKFLLS